MNFEKIATDVAVRVMEKIAGNALAQQAAQKFQAGGSAGLHGMMNKMTPEYGKPGIADRLLSGNPFSNKPITSSQKNIQTGLEGMVRNHSNGQNMAKDIAAARAAGDMEKVKGLQTQARENGKVNQNGINSLNAGTRKADDWQLNTNATIEKLPSKQTVMNHEVDRFEDKRWDNKAMSYMTGHTPAQQFNNLPEAKRNVIGYEGAGTTMGAIKQVNNGWGDTGTYGGYIKKIQDAKRNPNRAPGYTRPGTSAIGEAAGL